MEILEISGVSFGWEEMVSNALKKGRKRKPSEDMISAVKRAYEKGLVCLDMRSALEIYKKESDGDGYIVISQEGGTCEKLFVGSKAGLLAPAEEVAILLCTVGSRLIDSMRESEKAGDYLLMYYLDVFGVLALAGLSSKAHARVSEIAASKGWGAGPVMQPGSVPGWSVEGQRDLYRLAHGEKIGLTLNDASFLIPHLSESSLTGIGPHYGGEPSVTMCDDCPRRDKCLWRIENVSDE